MVKFVATFLADRRGATAIEYGVLAALLGIAIIGALTTLGDAITGTLYTDILVAVSS